MEKFIVELNIKKNGINKIIKFVNGGIENQKNYGVCTSDGEKIIDKYLLAKIYENKYDIGAQFTQNILIVFC